MIIKAKKYIEKQADHESENFENIKIKTKRS